MQLTLLDTAITELKNQVKAKKENIKKCQENFSIRKKKVATCREERGKPEASISADIEMVLEKYKWCKLPKNCRKLFRHNTRNCCGSTSKKRSNMQCRCIQGENASA